MANTIVSYLNDDYKRKAEQELPDSPQDSENLKFYKDALRKRIEAQVNSPTDQGGYSQVDLRPDWYKTFLKSKGYEQSAPPLQSKPAAAAEAGMGFVGNYATNRAKQLQGNDRGTGHAVSLSNTGALMGLGATLMRALSKKDSDDFDTQQARAVKDAQALKRNAKTGISTSELLGAGNLEKTSNRNEWLTQRDIEKAAGTIAHADKNSTETRNAREGAVASGVVAPDTANGLSAEQLQQNRTGFMQTQQQEHHDQSFDRERDRLEAEKLSAEERDELRRVDQEQRAKQQKVQENYIPGRSWAYDTPPDPATGTKAREFAIAQHDLVQGAQDMKKIQDRLLELGREAGVRPEVLGPAAFGQWVDKYVGTDEAKQLLSDAQLIQQKMVTAARKDDNLGVLQQFEKAMEDAVNPTAGTLGAFFRGSAPWNSIADYYTKYGDEKLRGYGSFAENDTTRPNADALMRPAEEQVRRFERPEVRRAPGSPAARTVNTPVGAPAGTQAAPAGGDEDYGAQPGDRLPVAPIPADARKPATPTPMTTRTNPEAAKPMRGMFTITKDGKTSAPRALTEEQYKRAIQVFGLDAVKQVSQ